MGLFSSEKGPETVDVMGRPFRCHVCGSETFWKRSAQLHDGVSTFFKVEWASPSCVCIICSSCGYVHWFFADL